MSCSCDVALILLAILLPRASGFLPGLAIAACILALLIPLRLWWFQSCRVALPRKYFLRMSKAQRRRVHQKHLRALWMKDRRERQRLQRVLWKMSRGFCASTNGASPVDTRRGSGQDINAVQKTSACKTVYPADEINALHVSSTNALSTFPDSCGQGVATPCLVHGGCRDHQLFWSFQHQQSGGRRTFQHLHDPAWQIVGAQDDEAPDIHGNGAAETSATSSGSSVNITGDADAIIIPGLSQASAQQARDAFKATFGGVICCDSFEHKEPHTSQTWHDSDTEDFYIESSCQEHRCDAISQPPGANQASSANPHMSLVSERAGKVEHWTKRSRIPGVSAKQVTFLASRGGGLESSEDFRNNPPLSLRLPVGGTQAVQIEASDLSTLVRHCYRKKNAQPVPCLASDNQRELLEHFAFIPPVFLACLLSYYKDALSLQCLTFICFPCRELNFKHLYVFSST